MPISYAPRTQELIRSHLRPSWIVGALEEQKAADMRSVTWSEYRDLLRLAQNRALKRVTDGR